MKSFATAILIFSTAFLAHSQTYEAGFLLGGANYIGDVGKTNYINPNSLAVGALFKWNRSPRHSFRGSFLVANIKGDDAKSDNSRRNERGYSFENSIKELSIGLEYTFWDFDVYGGRNVSTPYLYTGLTGISYNALYKKTNNEIVKYDNATTFAIPMVVGYKAMVSTNMMVGFEIGARYTFTDNLDGSNPGKEYKDREDLKFGHLNNDDWYVFTGITVTFAFGRKPCYCNF